MTTSRGGFTWMGCGVPEWGPYISSPSSSLVEDVLTSEPLAQANDNNNSKHNFV